MRPRRAFLTAVITGLGGGMLTRHPVAGLVLPRPAIGGHATLGNARFGHVADDLDPCVGDPTGRSDPALPGEDVTSGTLVLTLDPIEDHSGSTILTTYIRKATGEPVNNALVFLTARMPAMDHGVSAYPAQGLSEGRYRAQDISLGMPGIWIVIVYVIRQARAPASAAFQVVVADSEMSSVVS